MENLERIAGRLAHAVSAAGQTPEEMLESACLVAELATEFDAEAQGAGLSPSEAAGAPETTPSTA